MPTSIPGKSNSGVPGKFAAILDECGVRRCNVLSFTGQCSGFTLIELVVVISLISLLLAFSLPRFGVNSLTDDNRKATQWITVKIRHLKERAYREGKRYVLTLDIDGERMWITHEGMTEEERLQAENNAFVLPEGFSLLDVEYPQIEKQTTGRADIYFSPKGYSSRALIHLENNEQQQRSFFVEPFLIDVKVIDGYREFEA